MNTTTELSGTAAQGHVEEPERPLSPSTVAPSPTTPKAFEFGSISAEEAPLKPGTIRHFLHTIPLPPPKLREETSASGPPPPRVSSAANLTPAGWRPLQMMSSITKDELRFEVDRFLQEDVPLDLPAGRGSTKRDVKDLLSAYLVSPSEEFVDATNEDVQTDKIRQAFTTNQVFLRDVFPNSCQHEFRVWIPEVSEFPGDMKDPLGPHLFYLQAHWTGDETFDDPLTLMVVFSHHHLSSESLIESTADPKIGETFYSARYKDEKKEGANRLDQPCSYTDLMWTKVIDKCVALGCSRFIVTNYYHWTYGSFTPDFRECIVSEAIPYDNIAPRIQEVNLFWMSRRFGIPQNYDTADSSTYVSNILTLEEAFEAKIARKRKAEADDGDATTVRGSKRKKIRGTILGRFENGYLLPSDFVSVSEEGEDLSDTLSQVSLEEKYEVEGTTDDRWVGGWGPEELRAVEDEDEAAAYLEFLERYN